MLKSYVTALWGICSLKKMCAAVVYFDQLSGAAFFRKFLLCSQDDAFKIKAPVDADIFQHQWRADAQSGTGPAKGIYRFGTLH